MDRKPYHLLFLWGVLVFHLGGSDPLPAQDTSTSREYKIKAAFLFNFVKFVEWEEERVESATSPIKIGILGKDPFGTSLDEAIEGKVVRGRRLQILRFQSPEQLETVHVLFLCSSERSRLGEILDAVEGSNTLIVGDDEEFIDRGCHFGFLLKDNKVRLAVNLKALDLTNLRVSSKLLNLAEKN